MRFFVPAELLSWITLSLTRKAQPNFSTTGSSVRAGFSSVWRDVEFADVLRQAIRVELDLLDRALSVGLVDAHSPAGADAVGVEKHHDLADNLLLRPGFLDTLAAFWTDAVHVFQPGGLLLDDVEDALAEWP